MAGNAFNIGSDTTLTVLSNGVPLGAMLITDFESKQMTNRTSSIPINSDPSYREIETGWEGTFTYDRSNSVLDDFVAAKEAARYNGNPPPTITIAQTINELDGSITRYRFEGVSVKLDDAGSWKGDAKVEQKLGWVAGRRKKVS